MSEEGERSSMGIPRLASRFCRAQIDPSGHATWDSVPLSWGSESRRNGGRPVTYVEKFLYQTPSPWRSSTSWLGWWSQMRRKGLPTSRRSRAWWVSWLDSECGNQLQLSRDGGSSCIAPLAGDLACSCGAQTVLPKWLPIGGARGKPWDRGSDQAGCSPLGPQEIVGVGGVSSPTMWSGPMDFVSWQLVGAEAWRLTSTCIPSSTSINTFPFGWGQRLSFV